MVGFWSTLIAIVACALAVDATQIMRKPPGFNQTAHTPGQITKRDTGRTQFAYFTNWGIYSGYNFSQSHVSHLLPARLTLDFRRTGRHCSGNINSHSLLLR